MIKYISKLSLFFFIQLAAISVFAQEQIPVDSSATKQSASIKKSIIKVNLTGLLLKNYGFQFEQILKKRISLAVSYRLMPMGSVPFKKQIINQSSDPAAAEDALNDFRLGNSAITAEMRFYVGKKGYGRGFYMAPFYRYGKFNAEGISFDYINSSLTSNTISLSGELKGNTFGLLLGSQWMLGKNISLDWWIIGPHYGSSKGQLKGTSTAPLDQFEQSSLSETLGSFDLPLTTEHHTVTSNGAIMNFNGPWAGIRAGLMIGIKF